MPGPVDKIKAREASLQVLKKAASEAFRPVTAKEDAGRKKGKNSSRSRVILGLVETGSSFIAGAWIKRQWGGLVAVAFFLWRLWEFLDLKTLFSWFYQRTVDFVETVEYLQEQRDRFNYFWENGGGDAVKMIVGIVLLVLGIWITFRWCRKSGVPWLKRRLFTPSHTPGNSGQTTPEHSEFSDGQEDPILGPIMRGVQGQQDETNRILVDVAARLERLETKPSLPPVPPNSGGGGAGMTDLNGEPLDISESARIDAAVDRLMRRYSEQDHILERDAERPSHRRKNSGKKVKNRRKEKDDSASDADASSSEPLERKGPKDRNGGKRRKSKRAKGSASESTDEKEAKSGAGSESPSTEEEEAQVAALVRRAEDETRSNKEGMIAALREYKKTDLKLPGNRKKRAAPKVLYLLYHNDRTAKEELKTWAKKKGLEKCHIYNELVLLGEVIDRMTRRKKYRVKKVINHPATEGICRRIYGYFLAFRDVEREADWRRPKGDAGKAWTSKVKWGLAEEVDLIALEEKEGEDSGLDAEVAKSLKKKAYLSKQLGNIEVGKGGPDGS